MIRKRTFIIKSVNESFFCMCNDGIIGMYVKEIIDKVLRHKCTKLKSIKYENCPNYSKLGNFKIYEDNEGYNMISIINEELFDILVMKFVLISQRERVFEE